MNEEQYTETVKRLKAVNTVVKGLDPALRGEAVAILKPYVTGAPAGSPPPGGGGGGKGDGGGDAPPSGDLDQAAFFSKYGSDKPVNNVMPIAAWIYRQQGSEPFVAKKDVFAVAEEVGLVVTDRPERVLKKATEGGNRLFKVAGHGKLEPTVSGESYMRKTYGVKKPPLAPAADADK